MNRFGYLFEAESAVIEPETQSLVSPEKFNKFLELYNSEGRSASNPRELTPFLQSVIQNLGIRPKEIALLSSEAVKLGDMSDVQFGLIRDTLGVTESKLFEADPIDDNEGVAAPEEDKPEDGKEEPDLGKDVGGETSTEGAPEDGEEEPKEEVVNVEHPEEQVFGYSAGEGYTLKRVLGDDSNLEDLQIIDAAHNVLLSASKEGIDPNNVRDFLLFAENELKIGTIDAGIIHDYDLFGVEAARKANEEEMELGAGENSEIPGEVELPDAETQPGDFGYGEEKFNPMESRIRESIINEDRQKVFDEAGVDKEDWFRGGDNRIYFRCPDPALAQTVAAQLGARVDGEVQFEGLTFVRSVLEAKCKAKTKEGEKWNAIRANMGKGKVKKMAQKAAATRKKLGEAMLTEQEVSPDAVLKALGDPQHQRMYNRLVQTLKDFKAKNELTPERAKNIIKQFVTPVVHMLYLQSSGVTEDTLPYEKTVDEVVARLLGELGLTGKNESKEWANILEQVAKFKSKKVNEDTAVLGSGLSKEDATSMAQSKNGTVAPDPEDKTGQKFVVLAKDPKTASGMTA